MTFIFLQISPSAHFDSAAAFLFYYFDIFHSNFAWLCRFSRWAVLTTRSAKGLHMNFLLRSDVCNNEQNVSRLNCLMFDFNRKLWTFFLSSDFQAEGENEVNNELANRISLFYADATPMLKTLSDGTTKFVSEVRLQHLTATLAFKKV